MGEKSGEHMKNQEEKLGVGVCGCGAISRIYLQNMTHRFSNLAVVSCCARHLEHAQKRAEEFGIEAMTYEEMLQDERISLIVILTPAPTHAALIRQALLAGKHVYTEKAICLDVGEAKALQALAEEKNLYLSSAPDTFLGEALQTARRAIDAGRIGQVTGFSVSANRNQDLLGALFSFQNLPGGGIDLDYGVYYLTALVSLLGPIKEVSAMEDNPKPVRKNPIPQSPDFGREYASPNVSRVSALLKTKSGIPGTLLLDSESILTDLARFYIYGTEGVLTLCDANGFGGTVRLTAMGPDYRKVQEEDLDLGLPYADNARGIGPSEEAAAILAGRKSRTDCSMAIHVLDVLKTMERSSRTGKTLPVETACERPEML
jgi:predicted dehydrogenase